MNEGRSVAHGGQREGFGAALGGSTQPLAKEENETGQATTAQAYQRSTRKALPPFDVCKDGDSQREAHSPVLV